jgi:hypothetical protein
METVRSVGRLPPLSGRVKAVALAVLGLTLVAIVADTRRVRTGELLVQADDAAVRVVIRRGDRVVVPATESRSFVLRPGDYTVEVSPPGSRAEPEHVSIARGGRSVVRVVSPSGSARGSNP